MVRHRITVFLKAGDRCEKVKAQFVACHNGIWEIRIPKLDGNLTQLVKAPSYEGDGLEKAVAEAVRDWVLLWDMENSKWGWIARRDWGKLVKSMKS